METEISNFGQAVSKCVLHILQGIYQDIPFIATGKYVG